VYLPSPEGNDPNIPNAIEEVCKDIDNAIRNTVQKNLSTLKTDCERILTRLDARVVADKASLSPLSYSDGEKMRIVTLRLAQGDRKRLLNAEQSPNACTCEYGLQLVERGIGGRRETAS
jgi:hypothetical protein